MIAACDLELLILPPCNAVAFLSKASGDDISFLQTQGGATVFVFI